MILIRKKMSCDKSTEVLTLHGGPTIRAKGGSGGKESIEEGVGGKDRRGRKKRRWQRNEYPEADSNLICVVLVVEYRSHTEDGYIARTICMDDLIPATGLAGQYTSRPFSSARCFFSDSRSVTYLIGRQTVRLLSRTDIWWSWCS